VRNPEDLPENVPWKESPATSLLQKVKKKATEEKETRRGRRCIAGLIGGKVSFEAGGGMGERGNRVRRATGRRACLLVGKASAL